MEADTLIPTQYLNAYGHAYFRKDDLLACAPLLTNGGVDWDSWTIVEESPEVAREQMEALIVALGFDTLAVERVIAGIGWY
jgi:hypothetical protein